ncbi:MAG TPA: TRAP transporter substrate-binding protein [Hyphomicrobiaceae bacterium]|jgi:TRAP-type C4-dicarboxylate transport system substrate-binding protein|nr:TRAP transporter substrate-binding protein [Hyphomicrobiaceae bacterium]
MRSLRALSVAFGLTSAALLAPAMGSAWAQDKPVHLKIAHWVPPAHSIHKAMEDWGASLQKATNGTVTFTVFPSQQLGKAFDHYDMVRDGIADVVFINPGYQPGRFPIIDAVNLPFMMSKGGEGSQAADAWYRKYAAAEMKDVKYCFAFVHDYGSFHSRSKKIVVPGDLRGMKIRPAHATMAALVTQLGGTNVQSSAPEIRDVLEKGVADAATNPWGSNFLFGIDKVTKYHMNAPLYVTVFAWLVNKSTYQNMSPMQQKALDDHCNTDWALRAAGPWAEYERAGIAKMQADPAHEVYKITDEQLGEWRKAAAPVVKIWADSVRKVGADPDAALAELKASVAKYKALE